MVEDSRRQPTEPEVIDPDSLDFGLGVAFGAKKPNAVRGVAAAIARMTGAAPRVLLRDEHDALSPVLRLLPPGSAERAGDDGRYQVLGEIARGGLGVVFKGRDRDLGRDVALKVLRPEYAGNDAVLARFVEEAQIGGQLQHPGIVPVYSIGLEADGRPFFAMKLVKGRTLAALLAERQSPKEGLSRFLAVFEQVCRTIAYAHSRRVVHRDLKPSNVMLGAFAEVQVVDWGLAKVLGREGGAPERPAEAVARDISLIATVRTGSEGSASQAGSVMGTPGYMSPEQAIGREIDEKTDVFALGAVLCTILTGDAPFLGSERDQILLAAQGRLDDAYERLAACGADADLVAIAKKCLAAAPGGRFADAGAVADAVTKHLSGVEARTRKAEIVAANARVKAEDARAAAARERVKAAAEKSAHVRTIVLASVVLVAVVAGGAGFMYLGAEEDERLARTAESVSKSMAEASDHRGARDFAGAVAAAKKAVALAATGSAGAETSERAAKLLADVESDERAAIAAAKQAEDDAAFVARLEEIRGRRGDRYDNPGTHAEYATAFREAGFDLESGTPHDLGGRIRAHGDAFAVQVAAALDEWAWLRRYVPSLEETGAGRIEQAAQLADPDPWRNRLRDASARRDAVALRELAAQADVAALAPQTVDLLGKSLGEAGLPDVEIDVLRRAVNARPDDFWIRVHLAQTIVATLPDGADEALAHATAALALRPRATVAWNVLAIGHQAARDWKSAIAATEEAAQIAPGFAWYHSRLSELYCLANDRKRAIEASREAVRLAPTWVEGRWTLVRALAEEGRLDEALREANEGVRIGGRDPYSLVVLGQVAGLKGDKAVARAAFEDALRAAPEWPTARLSFATFLAELAHDDAGALAQYAEALRLTPAGDAKARAHLHQHIGVVRHDHGDLDAAVTECAEAVRLDPQSAERRCRLADVLRSKGDLPRALDECRQALRLDPQYADAHASLGSVLHAMALATQEPTSQRSRYEEALRSCRRSIELDARSVKGHFALCRLLLAVGEVDAAVASARETVRLDPMGAAAHAALGVSLAHQRLWDAALAECKRAIELEPGDASVHAETGYVHELKGDVLAAIASWQESIRLQPGRADTHSRLGAALANLRRFEEAVRHCTEADRLGAKGLHQDIASLLLRLGRPKEALEHALRARAAKPDQADLAGLVGAMRQECGDAAGAGAAFAEAIRLAPRDAAVRYRLGWTLQLAHRHKDAAAQFGEAVRLDPGNAWYRNWLADALADDGALEEAIESRREAVRLDPGQADYLIWLGFDLGRMHRDAQALETARSAVRVRPGSSHARHGLGRALMSSGAFSDALAEFRAGRERRAADPRWDAETDEGADEDIAACERLLALEPKLDAIRRGTLVPRGAADRSDFFDLCVFKRCYAAAARLWHEDIAAGASSAGEGADLRYNAACVALLAASGAGEDAGQLPASARADLRRQAVALLRKSLDHLRGEIRSPETPAARDAAHGTRLWACDPDLDTVRGAEAIAKLPADERAAWTSFWEELDVLIVEADERERRP